MLYGDISDAYDRDWSSRFVLPFEICKMHKREQSQMFYDLVLECFIAPLPHYWFFYLRSEGLQKSFPLNWFLMYNQEAVIWQKTLVEFRDVFYFFFTSISEKMALRVILQQLHSRPDLYHPFRELIFLDENAVEVPFKYLKQTWQLSN